MTGKLKTLALASLASTLIATASFTASAQETIKVGILHSLSGTMAISETTLKDAMLMLIDEQNKKGGFWASSLRLWLSIRHRTGRFLPKKPAS